MNTEKINEKKGFEVVCISPTGQKSIYFLKNKRSLIGRGHACDIILPSLDVSTIHAVIEVVNDESFKIYDLNSKSGTFVNGVKIILKDVLLNQEFKAGSYELRIREFDDSDAPPPPLKMLSSSSHLIKKAPSAPNIFSDNVKNVSPVVIPTVEYPLAKDPKAEFSEYIFEDAEELYPIFKYNIGHGAIEVIIVFDDRIQSVDYIPISNGIFYLVGSGSKAREIEYPYLRKREKVPFIKVNNGEAEVIALEGYKRETVGESTKNDIAPQSFLNDDEIIIFTNQQIKIFVRKTPQPPSVLSAPILRRDKDFKKYLFLILFLVLSFLTPFSLFEVDEEIEKEKAPERIATILYKRKLTVSKKKAIDKTKKAPKKIQKSPKQIPKKDIKKQTPKKTTKVKSESANNKKTGVKKSKNIGKVKKVTPNKGPRNIKRDLVKPKKSKEVGSKKGSNSSAKRKLITRKTKGNVDTYKSPNFKSTVSNLIAKGGSTKAIKAVVADAGTATENISISDVSPGSTLKTAKVSDNIGSLSGVTKGTLDSSKGVRGLVNKKNIYTAGLPYKTVIRGAIDPDVIRQILVENIPRFRYCYQKVLDRSKSAFNGIVRLNFIIGASGYVTKAGVGSVSRLPTKVKGCVVNVLRKIAFPPPLGGGVVEVNQPMNFYPNIK